ncbi:MAG: rod shape-determining protein MreD [Bacteroidales bacterium]
MVTSLREKRLIQRRFFITARRQTMINTLLRYSGLFVLIILIQVMLMDNIQFSGYINPYVYVLFIILLPFEIPSWLLLLLAFVTGMTIDLFSGTPGLHTSATLVAGFIRPYLLRLIAPREDYEQGVIPGIRSYGLRWFVIYASVLVIIHHFFLFYIEVFRFTFFFATLLRVILSALFTIFFILVIQTMVIRR